MTPKYRQLPGTHPRVETGAIQFEGDLPGLFIRGDDCFRLMHLLHEFVELSTDPADAPMRDWAERLNDEIHSNVIIGLAK